MSQPYQSPQPPRRSSAMPWIIVGVIAVLVVGGLIALFTLKPGGEASPTPTVTTPNGTQTSATPQPSVPDGPLLMPDEDYPAKIGNHVLQFVGGLPAYDVEGSTLGNHQRISVSDAGKGDPLPLEEMLKVAGIQTEELRPGIHCMTSGYVRCFADSQVTRRWTTEAIDGDLSVEELAAFTEEFVAATPS